MRNLNKRIVVSLFVILTLCFYQIQSVIAVTELDTITFTAYHLGGSEDALNYGGGSEWGRNAATLFGGKNVVATDHTVIRFSVNQECQPFYCIELGGHLDPVNGSEYSKNDPSFFDNVDNSVISGSQISDYLGKIMYFGFHDEFNYSGDNMWNVDYAENKDNISEYIATQTLIWETIYGYRDADFNYVSHDGYDDPLDFIDGVPDHENILFYYNKIVSIIKYQDSIPSFMFSSREEALNNPYELPFDYAQGLFTATYSDSNSRVQDFNYYVDGSTMYFAKYGPDSLCVSIPRNTTATKSDPTLLIIDPYSAGYQASNVTVWSCATKQNGITWGKYKAIPNFGYAAFYPGTYKKPDKGSISITKTGEAFTGINKITSGKYELNIPTYSKYTLQDVEFTIKAYEDIYYDYEILYPKGTIIETKKTNEEGKVIFDNLGYGKYEITETSVSGNDYIEGIEPIIIEINLNTSNKTIDKISKEVDNLYQKVNVGGKKTFEATDPSFDLDMNAEMSQVLIGLFSGEDIYGKNDAVLKKDSLIALAVPDPDGSFDFNVDLPSGEYYVKELEGSSNFILDDSIHVVSASCDENKEVTKYNSDDVQNKTGNINGIKKNQNGDPLKGATIGLFKDPECTDMIMETVTLSDGIFLFKDLVISTYYIKETAAPEGYLISDEIYAIEPKIIEDDEYMITIINDLIPSPTPSPTNTPTATPTVTNTPTPTQIPPKEETPKLVTTVTHDSPKPNEDTSTPTPSQTETPTRLITTTGESKSITTTIGLSILYSLILTAGIVLTYKKLLVIFLKRR
ncbi:MAG: Cys-Gln thioester bond-forming surface protein [Clostridia bacterium]|nr:Cys-Gln thioester bond-forming surface protein [Clostridia bacterium]